MQCSRNQYTGNRAFTLVELSIVIVVIGLIVSGVTAGQNLVKAARISAQISQIREIEIAFNTFRTTYGYSPGDLPNANSYWSTTGNGNGNGIINDAIGTTLGCMNDEAAGASGAFTGEKLTFFQQLSLAGMLKEQYNGTGVWGAGYPKLASNPGKSGIIVGSYWRPNGSTFGMAAPNANFSIVGPYVYLGLGAGANTTAYVQQNWTFAMDPLIPKDMYSIDMKIDDGLYNRGKFQGFSANYATCIASGNYNVGSTTAYCSAVYRLK